MSLMKTEIFNRRPFKSVFFRRKIIAVCFFRSSNTKPPRPLHLMTPIFINSWQNSFNQGATNTERHDSKTFCSLMATLKSKVAWELIHGGAFVSGKRRSGYEDDFEKFLFVLSNLCRQARQCFHYEIFPLLIKKFFELFGFGWTNADWLSRKYQKKNSSSFHNSQFVWVRD